MCNFHHTFTPNFALYILLNILNKWDPKKKAKEEEEAEAAQRKAEQDAARKAAEAKEEEEAAKKKAKEAEEALHKMVTDMAAKMEQQGAKIHSMENENAQMKDEYLVQKQALRSYAGKPKNMPAPS